MRFKTPAREFYRLQVYSSSIVGGTASDGLFQVLLNKQAPDESDRVYQFAIESFVTGPDAPPYICIDLPSLPRLNTYSTLPLGGGGATNVAVMAGNTYYRDINHNTVGYEFGSAWFFRNAQLEVRFTDLAGAPLTGIAPWVLTIAIWEVDRA